MKISKLITLFLGVLLVTSCTASAQEKTRECLATNTGYEFCVTPELVGQLSSEEMKASNGIYEQEVFEAGAISAATVYYEHTQTKVKHILMGLYLFPEDKFDAAANPNEPPRFGQEVIRTDGKVLSVAGPHDSMFEPTSQDGMNITALYDLMYDANSWKK